MRSGLGVLGFSMMLGSSAFAQGRIELRPDLVVRSVRSIEGSKIVVVVSNLGRGGSRQTVLRLEVFEAGRGGRPPRPIEAEVPPIAAGRFAIVTLDTGGVSMAGRTLRLTVDPAGAVAESDEGNNVKTLSPDEVARLVSAAYPQPAPAQPAPPPAPPPQPSAVFHPLIRLKEVPGPQFKEVPAPQPFTKLDLVSNPKPATMWTTPMDNKPDPSAVYSDAQSILGFGITASFPAQGNHTKYVLQFRLFGSNQGLFPSGSQPSDPCDGWQGPPKLILAQPLQVQETLVPVGQMPGMTIVRTASFQQVVPPPELSAQFQASPGGRIELRIVPLLENSPFSGRAAQCTGPPSNWVSVRTPGTLAALENARQFAQIAEKTKVQADLKQDVQQRYTLELLSYIPPKPYDDQVAPHMFRNRLKRAPFGANGTPEWYPGCIFNAETVATQLAYVQMQNESVGQQFIDLANGTVNMVSGGYESAKNFVVDVAASGIDVTGVVDCKQKCRDALKTTLEVLLSAAGIPPKVPNFQQLVAHGSAYLASSLAEEVVRQTIGVDPPAGAVEAATYEAKREAIYQGARMGTDKLASLLNCPSPSPDGTCFEDPSNPYTWGVPEPSFRAHPGMLYVRIRPIPGQKPGRSRIKGLRISVASAGTFADALLPLEYVPADGMVVPVVLWPLAKDGTVLNSSFPIPPGDPNRDRYTQWSQHFPMCGSSECYDCYEACQDQFGQNYYPYFGSMPVEIATEHSYLLAQGGVAWVPGSVVWVKTSLDPYHVFDGVKDTPEGWKLKGYSKGAYYGHFVRNTCE